eukprot:2484588-Pleurochrysis_carterae.AAC.1
MCRRAKACLWLVNQGGRCICLVEGDLTVRHVRRSAQLAYVLASRACQCAQFWAKTCRTASAAAATAAASRCAITRPRRHCG